MEVLVANIHVLCCINLHSLQFYGMFIGLTTCCIYFILVAWYRLKHPDSIRPKMQQIYAPLTQFEDDMSDTTDDGDEDL